MSGVSPEPPEPGTVPSRSGYAAVEAGRTAGQAAGSADCAVRGDRHRGLGGAGPGAAGLPRLGLGARPHPLAVDLPGRRAVGPARPLRDVPARPPAPFRQLELEPL